MFLFDKNNNTNKSINILRGIVICNGIRKQLTEADVVGGGVDGEWHWEHFRKHSFRFNINYAKTCFFLFVSFINRFDRFPQGKLCSTCACTNLGIS